MDLIKRHRYFIAFIATILIVAFCFYIIGTKVNSNNEAIEKSCILLDNAIAQSQGQSNGSSQILIREILLNANKHNRKYVQKRYLAAVKSQPPILERLNCKRLSEHPEDIVAVKTTIVPSTPTPTP